MNVVEKACSKSQTQALFISPKEKKTKGKEKK